jgi:acyl carrier protein
MERIKFKLNRILRNIGMEKNQIRLLDMFDQELKFDWFDEICYVNYIENSFNIIIPENDISELKTIDNAVKYLTKKTTVLSGFN